MHCEPWAKVVFTHRSDMLFGESTRRVVFLDNTCCLSPSGAIQLDSGNIRPISSSLLSETPHSTFGIYYSESGKCIVTSRSVEEGFQLRKITPFESTPPVIYSWKELARRPADLSPSGRFLVLGSNRLHDTNAVDDSLFVVDIEVNNIIELPFAEPMFYRFSKFHFLSNEMTLIAFILTQDDGQNVINVLVWENYVTLPKLTRHGKIKINHWMNPYHIYVNKDDDSALMVSDVRTIQPIEFGGEVSFPNAACTNGDYPRTLSFASEDGV